MKVVNDVSGTANWPRRAVDQIRDVGRRQVRRRAALLDAATPPSTGGSPAAARGRPSFSRKGAAVSRKATNGGNQPSASAKLPFAARASQHHAAPNLEGMALHGRRVDDAQGRAQRRRF